jgi:hypothetical protein
MLSEQHPEYFKQPIKPDAKGRIIPVANRWLKSEQNAFFERFLARLDAEFGDTYEIHFAPDYPEYHLGAPQIKIGDTEWGNLTYNFGKWSGSPLVLHREDVYAGPADYFTWDQLDEGLEAAITRLKEVANVTSP